VTLFCLSNNSDVEVIGSLLLVHCVLLPSAVCLFLSLLFLCADDISSYIDSLSCSDCEGHKQRIVSAPIVVGPLLSLKRRPYFLTCTCRGGNKNLGHGSRRESKIRITVLARPGSNLTDRYSQVRHWMHSEGVYIERGDTTLAFRSENCKAPLPSQSGEKRTKRHSCPEWNSKPQSSDPRPEAPEAMW
jgi:hypothetical protein